MRALLATLLLATAAPSARAVEVRSPEGELYAFPTLLDDAGNPVATSTLSQWFAGGRLHVRIAHRFPDGREAVERARFAQGKELVQEAWSWEERRGDALLRAFEKWISWTVAREAARASAGRGSARRHGALAVSRERRLRE